MDKRFINENLANVTYSIQYQITFKFPFEATSINFDTFKIKSKIQKDCTLC